LPKSFGLFGFLFFSANLELETVSSVFSSSSNGVILNSFYELLSTINEFIRVIWNKGRAGDFKVLVRC
jgi:hypothetical protein